MADFKIYSKDGSVIRFEGAPKYVGTYLKPGCLEFQEIGSDAPIDWLVGDYVDYSVINAAGKETRTGLRYKLYVTPKCTKQSEQGDYGGAFVYQNVQFFDACKELEIAEFIDLVPEDNGEHFSTQNLVAFTGKPYNVAERIQECMRYWFPESDWAVRVIDASSLDTTEDAELINLLDTDADFNVSGAKCLGALDKMYETWNGLGWSYSVENGQNVITIGTPNKRTSANTTEVYNRIEGKGLVSLDRSVSNADEIGTLLYVYGSTRNMSGDYYRTKNIKDAASVDIAHLMLPINAIASLNYVGWGKTRTLGRTLPGGRVGLTYKPDASKAFLESAAGMAKLGVIPKYAYFDGSDSKYPEIFPSIEGATIADVKAGKDALDESDYYPKDGGWSDTDRIDEIYEGDALQDDGVISADGKRFKGFYAAAVSSISQRGSLINDSVTLLTDFTLEMDGDNVTLEPALDGVLYVSLNSIQIDARLVCQARVPVEGGADSVTVRERVSLIRKGRGAYSITFPTITITGSGYVDRIDEVRLELQVKDNDKEGYTIEDLEYTLAINEGTISVGVDFDLAETFSLRLRQIGFNIDERGEMGNGKAISMKSGLCAGRDFKIKSCQYDSGDDAWTVTCYRSKDEDLHILFPNSDLGIEPGDRFVLLDIMMPELYISMASVRLLKAGLKLLADIDHEKPFYEPGINSAFVYDEGRILREGMYMHLKGDENVDGGEDWAIIDTLQIDEGAYAIPTYEVTLRKQKSVEWTENVNKGGDTTKNTTSSRDDPENALSRGQADILYLPLSTFGAPTESYVPALINGNTYKLGLYGADDSGADLSDSYVTLSGAQTITGAKTFSALLTANRGVFFGSTKIYESEQGWLESDAWGFKAGDFYGDNFFGGDVKCTNVYATTLYLGPSEVPLYESSGALATKSGAVLLTSANWTGYIPVPTKLSQLTNDSGFVTSSGITSVTKGTATSGGAVTTSGGAVTIQFPTVPTTMAWSSITGKPTSLSGYGITDGVNAVSVTGSGNAVTAASISGHTLTLTKGTSFLTSHQSIYSATFAAGAFSAKSYTPNSAAQTINIPTHTSHLTNNSGFLTSHQSLANYVTLNGTQTITGAKTFSALLTASYTTGTYGIMVERTAGSDEASIGFKNATHHGVVGLWGGAMRVWTAGFNNSVVIINDGGITQFAGPVQVLNNQYTYLSGTLYLGGWSSYINYNNSVGMFHSSVGFYSDQDIASGGAATSSDQRKKDNIKTISPEFAKSILAGLIPREWDWNALSRRSGHSYGFIAQEYMIPGAKRQIGGYWYIEYDRVLPMLVAGWQDHERRIAELERENTELRHTLSKLTAA